jgi:hypothetical protein
MKKQIIIIFLILNSSILFSQSNDWILYKQIDDVKISYQNVKCYPKQGFDAEKIIIKIQNTSKSTQLVSWKQELWYNDKCHNCDLESEEFFHAITIDGNSEIQGDCDYINHRYLTLFVKFIDENYKSDNVQVLTKFDLVNLHTEKIMQ